MRVFALLALTAGLCAIDATSAQAQNQPWPDFEGRWRQEDEESSALPLGLLELSRCGAEFCGRIVKDGTCEPVILRAKQSRRKVDDEEFLELEGLLQVDGALFTARLWKSKSDRLVIAALEETGSIYKRGLMTDTGLLAAGPALCATSPGS